MELAKRTGRIKLSATIKIADRVRELERKGEKIIRLETGEPHFPTPDTIKSATIKALEEGKTHYSHSRGIHKLRKLLCEQYNKKFKTNLDAEKNILITPGGKQAILYFILSVAEKGDEVLIPSPSWVSYPEIVRIADGTPTFVDCEDNKEFEISFEKIKQSITKKTQALILNNPNNPTGKIIRKETLEKINNLCVENGIFLLCDEIYDQIVFDNNEHVSLLSLNPELENCGVINGFSKTYSMTGWRLGYVISKPDLINAMLKFQQNSVTCPTTFIQFGAIEALNSGSEFVKKALSVYQENKDLLLKEFEKIENFRLVEPEGGLYAFIDISRISNDSAQFCLDLIDECRVSATPGVAFGDNGEGYIRICLATQRDNIVEFVKRIRSVYV